MNSDKTYKLTIVGGGLAGAEAAWQAAKMGIHVILYEMRPNVQTGAHQGPFLAELVCSNSLGSSMPDRASGILKNELRALNSLLIHCAEQTALPAGGALAVDRDAFAQLVTVKIENHPLIEVIRQEVTSIPSEPTIIASGPLTSLKLAEAIQKYTGYDNIFFYDALAPIVSYESIDMDIAFRGSRYGKNTDPDEGDYINCPMQKEQYHEFVKELIEAGRLSLLDFEKDISSGVRAGADKYFEGCLPVEVIARRGNDSLAYGPLRPVGLTDPRTNAHYYAVVQLRQDNLAKTLYNMVGFQTNLKYPEQERVFRMIPGLERAEFTRYGHMHRNTFIFSPALILPTLQFKKRENLFYCGQITGVEGYVGNIATGWLAGVNAARFLLGQPLIEMPHNTMIGALCNYITHADAKDFQPMKANMGILPELDKSIKGKRLRALAFAERAKRDLNSFILDYENNE